MLAALCIAAMLAGFEILLRVLIPDEQQPGPVNDPAPNADDVCENLPFGPAPRNSDD